MSTLLRSLIAPALILVSLSMIAGCEVDTNEGPVEETVDEIDAAVDG